MKAPEEYLEERQRHVHYEGTDAIYYFEERETLKALKSMQEDHEKELIEFAEYIKEADALGGYAWTLLTNEQKVVRFRNKQQDR